MENFLFLKHLRFFVIFSLISLVAGKFDEPECPEDSEIKIFCYFKSSDSEKFPSESSQFFDYNAPPCTHIIYAFATLDIDGNIKLPNQRQSNEFQEILRLKEDNPCLKVLISVGGWEEGSEKFSSLVENAQLIEIFSEKTLKFLIFHGFDGIDIHWMYPTLRGGLKEDRENFVKLVKSLKSKLSKRNKLVVAAVGTRSTHITQAYAPMKVLCNTLDFTILLTFDYYDRTRTSIGAPLTNENSHTFRETVTENLQKILDQNCPVGKLIFGISAYGRLYKLKRSTRHAIGADLSHEDLDIGSSRIVEYKKIRAALDKNTSILNSNQNSTKWTTHILPNSLSKYSYHDREWVSYDDHKAVELKTLFALKNKLAGIMFYTLNADSSSDDCRANYTLIKLSRKLIEEFTIKCKNSRLENCVNEIKREHNIGG